MKLVLIGSLCLFLTSCATGNHALHRSLDAALDHMTYDDALRTYGPPASIVEGDDIIIAEWRQSSSSVVAMPMGNNAFALPLEDGELLRLTFDKPTRKLIEWNHNTW